MVRAVASTPAPDCPGAVRIVGMDHIVLVTADVERLVAWYRGVLGLTPERSGRGAARRRSRR